MIVLTVNKLNLCELNRREDGGVSVREAGQENPHTSQQPRAAGGVHDRRRARVRPWNGIR